MRPFSRGTSNITGSLASHAGVEENAAGAAYDFVVRFPHVRSVGADQVDVASWLEEGALYEWIRRHGYASHNVRLAQGAGEIAGLPTSTDSA